jgi:hypothetical protein
VLRLGPGVVPPSHRTLGKGQGCLVLGRESVGAPSLFEKESVLETGSHTDAGGLGLGHWSDAGAATERNPVFAEQKYFVGYLTVYVQIQLDVERRRGWVSIQRYRRCALYAWTRCRCDSTNSGRQLGPGTTRQRHAGPGRTDVTFIMDEAVCTWWRNGRGVVRVMTNYLGMRGEAWVDYGATQ